MTSHQLSFNLEKCLFQFKVTKLNGAASADDLLPQFSHICAHAVHVSGTYTNKVQINRLQTFAVKSARSDELEIYGVTSDSMPTLNSLVKHFIEKGFYGEGVMSIGVTVHGTFAIIHQLPPILLLIAQQSQSETYRMYIVTFKNKMCLGTASKQN